MLRKYTIVLLLFVLVGTLTGQRSLYHEALSLARAAPKTAKIDAPLFLEYMPAETTSKRVLAFKATVSYGYDTLISADTTFLPIHAGPLEFDDPWFNFEMYHISPGDSISVRYGPFAITADLGTIQFQPVEVSEEDDIKTVVQGGVRLSSSLNGSTDSLSLYIHFYSDGALVGSSVYHAAIDYGGNPAAVFATLRQNMQLREGQQLERVMTKDLRQSYATNPFFSVNELLRTAAQNDSYRLADFGPDAPSGTDLYAAFPYLKLLRGDSTLASDQLSVGVDDLSSYRQRIVTAQNRLEDANSAFERQRKKGGLLDVNTVAVGLSDFIAERAQEELNLTFFNRFKENLAKDSELTVLFPATRDLLNKFEISNYKVFLAHARETFNADLDQLGVNLSGILNLPKYQRFKNDPNVFNLALIYDIANAAYQEKTVEEILLTTHQRLVERQQDLSESINQAIADSLYLASPSGGTTAPPAFPFRTEIHQYFRELDDLSRNLNNSIAALSEPSGDTIFSFFADQVGAPLGLPEQTGRPGAIAQLLPGDEQARSDAEEAAVSNQLLARQLAQSAGQLSEAPGYGPQRVRYHGERIYTPYIRHEINFIDAYLEGHDFFGYYLQKDGPLTRQRLRAVVQEEPMSYLAKGLDRSRKFLDIPFEELAQRHHRTIKEAKRTLVAKQRDTFDDIDGSFDSQIRFYYRKGRFHLVQQMYLELEALRRAVGRPIAADRYLVALALLLEEAKTATYTDEFYVSTGYNTFITKTSAVDGTNRVLDRLEREWRALIREALDYHGDQPSRITAPQVNPAYALREEWDDFIFLMDYFQREEVAASAEAALLSYYLFTDTDQPKQPIREALGAVLGQQMEEYRTARRKANELKPEALTAFEGVDVLLERNERQIEALGVKRKWLQGQLDSLEMATVPELVAARENAKALASTVELSAHALFAFRDYSQRYDTLFYLDTQQVEITVQNTDPATGMVHTFKKDSFLVERTPVPGTTDPIPVAKWITPRQFTALRRDPQAWNIFLGLLYQRLGSVPGAPRFSTRGVATLAAKFHNVATEIQESHDQLRFKKGTTPKQVGVKDYFPFIRSTVDLLNIVLTTPVEGNTGKVNGRTRALGKITEISNEALSLYENIDVREYGNAILNATELLRIITDRQFNEAELKAMTKAERKQRLRTQRQVGAIFKYGTFMAEMINAQSSDQVKNILKSTTLPPGSSRIKREVLSNITINSYLGAGLGRDRLLDAPADINADALGAALSVPIGLTYSFSPGFLNNRSSFSVHVPLLDLGAITAYRSNPNGQTVNADALPELEWKNLFSPGAYLVYNFADSPFSVGVGGQYGPQLRQLNQANGEPIFLNSWRFPMIFASIDVPFYNLHTGPRKIVVK